MPIAGDEHKISLDSLFARLHTSAGGISADEAKRRLAELGENVLVMKKQRSWTLRFLGQFVNFFAILLLVGSALSFLAEELSPGDGNMYIGIALLAVVILNAVFTFIQEFQSEKIMDSFRKMMPDEVEVVRDGKVIRLSARLIVPGDIILLEEGQKIPADGRLIEQNAMKVDHSSITGESEPQLRSIACTHDNLLESRNMVFSGTLVQSGNGRAVIYSTGMDTQIGRIVSLTKDTKEVDTPLHRELNHFIRIISTIAIVLGILFFGVSAVMGKHYMASLIFAIGIIVANVPEGLLPTVTLALSMASKRMAAKNALIKNLESVETLGSTTVICTDKTGTLTENRMSVVSVNLGLSPEDCVSTTEPDSDSLLKDHDGFGLIIRAMALCNNAHRDGKDASVWLGDPTETALMDYADRHTHLEVLTRQEPRKQEFPFDSKTKRMITVNRSGNHDVAYIKGAPEVVLDSCDRFINSKTSKTKKLSQKERNGILSANESLAKKGERVLGFAYKMVDEEKFVWLGLAGMVDPPRHSVAEAIDKCHTAGIRVIMITGDYSTTAEAIARKVGLVRNDGVGANIVTGSDLDNMDESVLSATLKKSNLIFARTQPAHKLRIVRALQAMGEVVTVTGDGVNDAPALKNADMGVAMGKVGTEVAREASKMVLLDDNFATIVHAIEEGRTIYDNIKKFIAYILTSNIPEILPFIAFVLLGIPLPLTVVLILAIDLGTDLVPALGLGSERAESDVMQKKPRDRKERLLTPKLLFRSYGIIGMFEAAAGFLSLFVVLYRGGWSWGQDLAMTSPLYMKAVSAFFASIIICQIANVMICRTRRESIFKKGLFSNELVLVGIVTELTLLAIIIYMPWAQPFFGTVSLSWFELSLSIPFALFILLFAEIRKWFVRRDNAFVLKYLKW